MNHLIVPAAQIQAFKADIERMTVKYKCPVDGYAVVGVASNLIGWNVLILDIALSRCIHPI